jgi:hypothetical protein
LDADHTKNATFLFQLIIVKGMREKRAHDNSD